MNHRCIVLILAISLIALVSGCEAGGSNPNSGTTTANTNTAPRTEVRKPTVDEIREVLAAQFRLVH